MYPTYIRLVSRSEKRVTEILDSIPEDWAVDKIAIERKLQELFAVEWIDETWFNFKDLVERV